MMRITCPIHGDTEGTELNRDLKSYCVKCLQDAIEERIQKLEKGKIIYDYHKQVVSVPKPNR